MTPRTRNVILVLVGVAALVMTKRYAGPGADIAHSYGGNVSASFAVYFLTRNAALGWGWGRALAASVAFLVVALFEVTNGFGVMTNVYDPADLAADAFGVGLALVIDSLATRGK